AVLRCLGGLGAARRGAGLRDGPVGDRDVSLTDSASFACGGEWYGTRKHFEKEVSHDPARDDFPRHGRVRLPGGARLGGLAAASGSHLGGTRGRSAGTSTAGR